MSGALTPVGADDFAGLLRPFLPLSNPVAVAVSGGPDSMAMAFCAHRWAQQNGHRCIGLIVDHNLRPDAAAEATQTRDRLAAIGMESDILRWDHAPIASRLHEQARAARYRLLADACRRHGARDLLIAHHRDDQAETILMRLAKGSGIDGLAGMAAQRIDDSDAGNPVRILRPFLSVPRARLAATCAAAGLPFVTDPGNASDKFARGRLRTVMPLLAPEGFDADRLIDLGARAAEAAEAIDFYARALLRGHASFETGGSITLGLDTLRETPKAVAARAVVLCLRHIHDDGPAPERASLSALLDAVMNGLDAPRTLHGCILSPGARAVTILREAGTITDAQPFRDGDRIVWDKRWCVEGRAGCGDGILRALGTPPHDDIDRLAPGLRRLVPQGRVRAALPALWRDGAIAAIPAFDKEAAFRLRYRKQPFP